MLKPSLNEGIKDKIQSMSKDGKVELNSLLKDKNIQTLLNSLLKDILQGSKSKDGVKQALINSKSMFDFKSVSSDLKDILSNPKLLHNQKLKEQVSTVKNFLVDIKDMTDKNLKSNMKNSGVFLESKLLKNEPNITSDLKASLLQIKDQVDDPKIQKVLDQVSYHQLLSFSSYSNSTFLPFMWDNIEDGSVSFNENEKDVFTCSIDLTLKEYGEFKSVLLLEQKNNLSLNLRIKSDVLKQKVQDNLNILRTNINKIGLNLISLNVLKYDDNLTKEQKAYQNNMNKLSYGIDIKA
jgi:hypothetical protein